MTFEIIVGPVVYPFELLPAERELVLDVEGGLRVVGELVRPVLLEPQLRSADTELVVVVYPRLLPVLEPFLVLRRLDEELHLHLLELAGAEDEVLGRYLVSERLAYLGDAERDLHPAALVDVLEIHVYPLSGLRSEEDDGSAVLHRTDVGLEHEVELSGRSELASAFGANV